MLALYDTRSSAISLLPNAHANINGVLPNLSVYSISAPSSINPRTHVNLLFSIASEIGVLPASSIGSTSAPCPIIIKIEFMEPLTAAIWIGERLRCSSLVSFRFTSRPCSKNRLTLSSLSAYISETKSCKKRNKRGQSLAIKSLLLLLTS